MTCERRQPINTAREPVPRNQAKSRGAGESAWENSPAPLPRVVGLTRSEWRRGLRRGGRCGIRPALLGEQFSRLDESRRFFLRRMRDCSIATPWVRPSYRVAVVVLFHEFVPAFAVAFGFGGEFADKAQEDWCPIWWSIPARAAWRCAPRGP
jgi:hypothetical protein